MGGFGLGLGLGLGLLGGLGYCDLACAVLTYGGTIVLLPLLLGLPQVRFFCCC